MGVLTSVCMYCGASMGTKDSGPNGATGVSHGICPTCERLSDDELDALARKPKLKTFTDFFK